MAQWSFLYKMLSWAMLHPFQNTAALPPTRNVPATRRRCPAPLPAPLPAAWSRMCPDPGVRWQQNPNMGQHTSLHLTRSVATSVKPPGRSLHPSRCSSLYGTTASPRGSCCRRRDAPGRRGCCLATTSRNGVFASRAAALHSCGLEPGGKFVLYRICSRNHRRCPWWTTPSWPNAAASCRAWCSARPGAGRRPGGCWGTARVVELPTAGGQTNPSPVWQWGSAAAGRLESHRPCCTMLQTSPPNETGSQPQYEQRPPRSGMSPAVLIRLRSCHVSPHGQENTNITIAKYEKYQTDSLSSKTLADKHRIHRSHGFIQHTVSATSTALWSMVFGSLPNPGAKWCGISMG